MTQCQTYQQMLMQQMDKELSAADEQRLSAHLRICPDCRALAEQLEHLANNLRQDALPEPPAHAEAEIMAVIRSLPPYGSKVRTLDSSLKGLWSLAAFGVMLLIRLLTSGWIGPTFLAELGRWADSLAIVINGIQLFMEIVGALFGNMLDAVSRQLMFLVVTGAAFLIILAFRSMIGAMRTWTDPLV